MYKSFAEGLHALETDRGMKAARGGVVIKHAEGFTYRLHGQPDDGEGELFFEIVPSVKPGELIAWPVTDEAREAYYC